MILFENYSLKNLTTFNIDVKTEYFISVNDINELKRVFNDLSFKNEKKMVLGGGSNVLFLNNYKGIIIKLNTKEISIIDEDKDYTTVYADAGVEWDELVSFAVKNNLGGIENLSIIPGTCGAAPIQNIGAYGQEVKDTLAYVEYLDLNSKEILKIEKNDIHFGYRKSIFKSELKNKVIITGIVLKLKKNPNVNITYGSIKEELKGSKHLNYNVAEVRQAVIKIRNSKLPDPKKIGNAGSFFKNPEITKEQLNKLKLDNPDIPVFPLSQNTVKISAAWLIEHSGWKGKKEGNVGCYERQSLILVNYGNASGEDVYNFAQKIKESVSKKFNIEINEEVNIIKS